MFHHSITIDSACACLSISFLVDAPVVIVISSGNACIFLVGYCTCLEVQLLLDFRVKRSMRSIAGVPMLVYFYFTVSYFVTHRSIFQYIYKVRSDNFFGILRLLIVAFIISESILLNTFFN